MPRPSRLTEKRHELLPVVAAAFAELGYRRASTAELARRCGVQELILYRLWPDKKAMFLAAIDHVFERSLSAWTMELAARPTGQDALTALIAYEARHHGEHGLYRIVFAGLGECDDPQLRAAWGLIGLGTVTNIVLELGLLGARARQELFLAVAQRLVAAPSRS